MKKILFKYFIRLTVLLVFVVQPYACANRGPGPQGGPKDTIPPRMLKATPSENALNFTKNKIEIEFDENIVVKDIPANVIISPPQKRNPDVRAIGKKLSIELKDTLEENTTYTINFGSAIRDNNEGNILEDYVYSFATGDYIDTLRISGVVINAETLNPIKGVFVGLHSDLNDSAFTSHPFRRVTKSNAEGHFTVHNLKEKEYRIYALDDRNNDLIQTMGEGFAFGSEVLKPELISSFRNDTIWKDSVSIDTIIQRGVLRYKPDDVVLKYSQDKNKRQYLLKLERNVLNQLQLFFNARSDSLPKLSLLDEDFDGRYLLHYNQNKDSLTYWLTDSLLIKRDTLHFQVEYLKSDSLMNLVKQTDTIRTVLKKGIREKAIEQAKKDTVLHVKDNFANRFDIYKDRTLSFTEPISSFDKAKIHVEQYVDTNLVALNFQVVQTDSVGLNFQLDFKIDSEEKYQLRVDSAAFKSVYNKVNNSHKSELTVRSIEDYATLTVKLVDFDSTAVFQVVNTKDVVVKTVKAKGNPTTIEHLEPGEYYLRMFLDKNGNGKWDGADIKKRIQPEEVFYYSKKMTLIANWEFEEEWNHKSVPLLQQKAEELQKVEELKKEK